MLSLQICTHHTFHGQTRLKKKERNRRRPGCRRRRPYREGELLPWALLFPPGEPSPLSRNLSNPSPDHSHQSPTSLVREWTASNVPLDSPGQNPLSCLSLSFLIIPYCRNEGSNNTLPSGWFSSGRSGFHPIKTTFLQTFYFHNFLSLNKYSL